jgi:hypothetical protein
MRKATAHSATLSLAICMAVGAAGTGVAATPQRTLFDSGPVGFTEKQAQRGRIAYVKGCASCHGRHLNDGQFGPPMKGAVFAAHWSNQSPEALRSLMVQRVPPASPGSLDSRTYTDIEAHLLLENGGKAGATELVASDAPAAAGVSSENGREARMKGLAIYGDTLFAPTADGHIVALDVRTGKSLSNNDALYTDSTVALDADTGKLSWYYHRPGCPQTLTHHSLEHQSYERDSALVNIPQALHCRVSCDDDRDGYRVRQ